MLSKYIEEDFQRYFISGKPVNGRVDIATMDDPTFVEAVSLKDSGKLIADRDAVVDKLCATAIAFAESNPDAFAAFWYGNK